MIDRYGNTMQVGVHIDRKILFVNYHDFPPYYLLKVLIHDFESKIMWGDTAEEMEHLEGEDVFEEILAKETEQTRIIINAIDFDGFYSAIVGLINPNTKQNATTDFGGKSTDQLIQNNNTYRQNALKYE